MVGKLTMFEVHLDGARFGPTTHADEDVPVEDASEPERMGGSQKGGSKLRALFAVAAIAALVVGLRKLRARRAKASEYDIHLEDEPEPVPAE